MVDIIGYGLDPEQCVRKRTPYIPEDVSARLEQKRGDLTNEYNKGMGKQWITDDHLRFQVPLSWSWAELQEKLQYRSRAGLKSRIKKLGLTTDHFVQSLPVKPVGDRSRAEIEDAAKNSVNFSDLAWRLGYRNVHKGNLPIRRICNRLEVDTSHFKNQFDNHKDRKTQRDPYAALRDIFGAYRGSAKRRNLEFSLSLPVFVDIILSVCRYCGKEPSNIYKKKYKGTEYLRLSYNGIDRIDNLVGYIEQNCVPCCRFCNCAKRDAPLWLIYKIVQINEEMKTMYGSA